MTDETMPAGLWRQTQAAVDAWEVEQPSRGTGPAALGPPTEGQVLVLPELDEPRVVWAVLGREAGEAGRWRLVAADVNPRLGPGDLRVSGPAVGALTLRCRLQVRLAAGEMGASTLLGTLPPEALAGAEARLQEIAGGRLVPTFSEQEAEEDPEYQDWIEEVVRPARGKLQAKAGIGAPERFPERSGPLPAPNEVLPGRRGAWMRWAAVLAFVGLGAASGFLTWRQAQEIAGLRTAAEASTATHRRAVAELETRRAELEASYRARLRAAGEEGARLEAEHRARLKQVEEELAKLRQATDVRNPQVATLSPNETQRGPKRFAIGKEVSHLVLVMSMEDPAGTEFQAVLAERGSEREVFVQKGLRVNVRGEVSLGVPAVLLHPADYRLRLYRKEGAKLRLVREHLIEIEEGAARRPPRW